MIAVDPNLDPMRQILPAMICAMLMFPSMLSADQPLLTKSLFSLDDFYYSYSRQIGVNGGTCDQTTLVSSMFRDAFQYEFSADTLWVKVFITTAQGTTENALNRFREMHLRGLSQFGNIYAARINLLQLPDLDKLAFVERIEPVVPDGSSAHTSPAVVPFVVDQKKN